MNINEENNVYENDVADLENRNIEEDNNDHQDNLLINHPVQLDSVVSGDHINNEMANDSINEDDDVNASFSDGSLNLRILNGNGGEVEEKPILAEDDADDLDPGGIGAGEHIPWEIQGQPVFLLRFYNRLNDLYHQENPNKHEFE